MAGIRTVTTLRKKRDEIVAVIKVYERQLVQARADLARVNAAMRLFDAGADVRPYVDIYRVLQAGSEDRLMREKRSPAAR